MAAADSARLICSLEEAVMAALSCLGVAANLNAAVGIRSKFDVSGVVFLLAYLDSLVSLAGSTALAGIMISLASSQSYWNCSALFVTLNLSNVSGLIISAEIAAIR